MPESEAAESWLAREVMLPIVRASLLGTTIGWYDVFVSSFFAVAVFPFVFFPKLDLFAGVVASFTTSFVGFAARPMGV